METEWLRLSAAMEETTIYSQISWDQIFKQNYAADFTVRFLNDILFVY